MAELITATKNDDLQCVGCGEDRLQTAKKFTDGIRCERCEICEVCGTDENLGTQADRIVCIFCA